MRGSSNRGSWKYVLPFEIGTMSISQCLDHEMNLEYAGSSEFLLTVIIFSIKAVAPWQEEAVEFP